MIHVGEQVGTWLCIGISSRGMGFRFWRCVRCDVTRETHIDHIRRAVKIAGRCHNCRRIETARLRPTYQTWRNMVNRCTDDQNDHYADYGGRGITVCERWASSFEAFVSDVGERPPGLQIDRIDNDGNYEPGNVRWATCRENSLNRRNTIRVEFRGEQRFLVDVCAESNMDYFVVHGRLRNGWDLERAISTPRMTRAEAGALKGRAA